MKQNHQMQQAFLWKRGIAYLIDWYISAVLISIPVMMMHQHMFSTPSYIMNLQVFPLMNALFILLLCIGIICVYFIWIPYKCSGKTLGKKIMGIKIMEVSNKKLTLSCLCLRQLFGCILVEGSLYTITPLILQVVFYGHNQIIQYMIYVYYFITIVTIVCMMIRKKALHDMLSKTIVVHG